MASGCHACRLSSLRLFVGGNLALPVGALGRNATRSSHVYRNRSAVSSYSSYSTFRPTLPRLKQPAIAEQRERPPTDADNAQRKGDTAAADGDIPALDAPWYLQVEAPRHPTLIHEAPPLPEIPSGAPQLVKPLVQFVAEELGLDQLSLLDLRDLDPPPALGPDLLMLIGTARSERHLHVSADRLVRWLRGRGLSAGADGLLGRNELKVRMRRRARKAKLLGGNGVVREADDGISTGWVCVNLGTVGWTDAEAEVVGEDGRSVGFGVPQTGTTIVVQLLTEQKRAELQLEKLWNGILRRSRARTQSLQEPEQITSGGGSLSLPKPRAKPRSKLRTELRLFSTSARHSARSAFVKALSGESGSTEALATTLEGVFTADSSLSEREFLEQLKMHVKRLSDEDATSLLVPGENGQVSRLERLLGPVLEDLPPAEVWEWQLWLETEMAARNIGSLDAHMASLHDLVQAVQQASFEVTREQYLSLIKLVFARTGNGNKNKDEDGAKDEDDLVRQQCALAMQVAETMHERGQQILDHDALVTVIESLVRRGARGPEAQRVQSAFEHLLTQADLPCPPADLLTRLLDAYAHRGDWDGFWRTWRIPPRFCSARTPAMYALLFRRLADDAHQARCIEALRWAVPEMAREEPPVPAVGAVLDALKACARVADPRAEHIAENVVVRDLQSQRLANREFVKLFRSLGVGSG